MDEQSQPVFRGLDAQTISALMHEVGAAKERGWLQADLRRLFKRQSIDNTYYKAAMRGELVLTSDQHGFLTALSITGLADFPHAPAPEDIRAHIEWLIEPARGAYDDALIEIAYDGPGRGLNAARLFGLDEIDQAVNFVLAQNVQHSNMYIGAALRLPDTKRFGRCSSEDFYVATAVPIDIDKNYDETRARMAAVCEDGLVVTTGLSPERRSQHWARLIEPCDNDVEFGAAFAAMVNHTGADMAVKDSARVMRLAGTISFPSDRKVGLGYCTELTVLAINAEARPSSLEAFLALSDGPMTDRPADFSNRPSAPPEALQGIVRDGGKFGTKVTNGREAFFRNIVLRHLSNFQSQHGADPGEDELWETAFPEFEREAINDDQRWTSPAGQKELRHRVANTLRRLRVGRLAKLGLYSIDTGVGMEVAQKAKETPQLAPVPAEDVFESLSISDIKALPDAEWTVEDILPKQGLGFIYGAPGSYKTFICYDLALSLAYGLSSWLDKPISHKGSVLYIAAEGVSGFKNRISAWQRKRDAKGDEARFRLIKKSMSFMDADDIGRLDRTVADIVARFGPVDTVFVDTVSRVLPGADENLQKDMTIFVAACDRIREGYGATVVGVHHTNKNGDMRGSTVFLGQGDFVLRVDKNEEGTGGFVTCEKQKDAEDGWKKLFLVERLEWLAIGKIKPNSSLVINFDVKPSELETLWPAREVCKEMQRLIENAWVNGRAWSPHKRAASEGKYVIRNLSEAIQMRASTVEMVVEKWLANEVIVFEFADAHTKAKGLKVAKWID